MNTSSPLGSKSCYVDKYDNSLIFAIPRSTKRSEIGIPNKLPFFGYDIWNAYELSWLCKNGCPRAYIAEIIYSCESEFIIESKSLKLYLNSFNNTTFESSQHVKNTMERDLSHELKTNVIIKLTDLNKKVQHMLPKGINIDNFYSKKLPKSSSIVLDKGYVRQERLFTNLLKSNCPVTAQPDWGTLMIKYSGQKINYTSLLNYIISLRNLNEFHEQCVEKIYVDIHKRCNPEYLEVYARYTRRGGIDINPYRCSEKTSIPKNYRISRQ